MAGGQAANSGIQFQARTGAWLASYMLASRAPRSFDLGPTVKIASLHFETNAAVDDVLAETSDGGFCFVNAKARVSSSTDPDSFFGSVIDQFAKQWIQSKAGGAQRWQRPLDVSRDRLILAVSRRQSAAFANSAKETLRRIKSATTLDATTLSTLTKIQTQFLRNTIDQLRRVWESQVGTSPTDRELFELLSLVRVVDLDLDDQNLQHAESILESEVTNNPAAARRLFEHLESWAIDCARSRSGSDREALVGRLDSEHFSLRPPAEFRSDIARLKVATDETLQALDRFSHLKIPDGAAPITIDRPCTEAIARRAAEASFLLIGEPGAGKSGALTSAARRLLARANRVVMLAVDRHSVATLGALNADLGLQHSLPEVLANWEGSEPGILFVDALDASRGGPSEGVFRELIARVLKIPGWHVVASIRRFDLRFGAAYQDMFQGPPIDSAFADNQFKGTRHLFVRLLDDAELAQVWTRSPILSAAFKEAHPELQQLVRSPFNLFLLSSILGADAVLPASVSTQVELLDRYWLRRVFAPSEKGYLRERALTEIVERMVGARSLTVVRGELSVDAVTELPGLQSGEVLLPSISNLVGFSHHMLFDYAATRLILQKGHASDLEDRLGTSEDHALMLAPSVLMAFQLLWEEDAKRLVFWKEALRIAGSPKVGAFARMLAARVFAPLVRGVADVAGLAAALQSAETIDAARFLVSHCFGNLIAELVPKSKVIGVESSPWPTIALHLMAADPVGTWPWNAVVSQWTEEQGDIHPRHRRDINLMALSLIRRALAAQDERSVIAGLRGGARTAGAASTETEQRLSELLTPDRVATHGHLELFWFAQELDQLLAACPNLVPKIFRAAFLTPLPSADEKTPMGESRILSLVSNKRQDFEGARRLLADRFRRFFEAAPVSAFEFLLDAVDHYMRTERPLREVEPIRFAWGETTATYRSDWSSIWWEGAHTDEQARMVSDFVEGFGSIADSANTVADILQRVANSHGWACIWNALFRICAAFPKQVGTELVDVFCEPRIIGSFDCLYPASIAISACFSSLSSVGRLKIERAILLVEHEASRANLLAAVPSDLIASPEARDAFRAFSAQGAMQRAVPRPRPQVRWVQRDDEDLAREYGILPEDGKQRALLAEVQGVENDQPSERSDEKVREHWLARWPRVRQLQTALGIDSSSAESLRRHGWDVVARVLMAVAEASDTPQQLAAYPDLQASILDVLDNARWPTESGAEEEARFASGPSWGEAPRASASAALVGWIRAHGLSTPELDARLRGLARDPSPIVRHHVCVRVNCLAVAAPALMWSVCEVAFREERNTGVLGFLLGSCRHILHLKPDWFAEKVVALDNLEPAAKASSDYVELLVDTVLQLWLVHQNNAAEELALSWARSPIEHADRLHHALHSLRPALVQGDPVSPSEKDERVRRKAISFLNTVVGVAAPHFESAIQRRATDEAKAPLTLLDAAMTQLYFASGAQKQAAPQAPDPRVGHRFFDETMPLLRKLGTVPYPSVTHYFLETLEHFIADRPGPVFDLLVYGLTSGGAAGGYQLEDMGARLFVKIVRRYLADYRNVISESAERRRGLAAALDQFVQVGWPEARRLVYELPETLR